MLNDGSYWNLNIQQKEEISPEVYQVKWIDIDEAILIMESAEYFPIQYVNEWQQQEFEKYSISQRDPMYQSMMVLREIRELSTPEEIMNHSC